MTSSEEFRSQRRTSNYIKQEVRSIEGALYKDPVDFTVNTGNSFVEIDHEIFSTVILSLPLIQEGQLSVSGERMCTVLVSRLED